ncbi:GspH/FimT family pseudopilin [Croceicoccus bisphenolivorans]|uniref:GspH/FimT family pseudopilin n=1 Tax=Croceicoccus bisphenolivorans TaxID=1783232 RepID=UPI00082E1DC3|nr:GspH/FimT family pseudopilin [Croceicoccus bisphenolivorans]
MQPRPTRRKPRNGFSLVELMVVLFVIALMAGAAVLTMPDGSGDLRREAERFAARTMAARDEAIATSASVSTVVGPAGYYYERRVDGRWAPLDGTLDAADWEDGTIAAVKGRSEGAPANRRVVFDPLGLASEDLRLRLSHDGNAMVVTVRRNGEVAVSAN